MKKYTRPYAKNLLRKNQIRFKMATKYLLNNPDNMVYSFDEILYSTNRLRKLAKDIYQLKQQLNH